MMTMIPPDVQEWERCYSLTKARCIQQASRAIAAAQAHGEGGGGESPKKSLKSTTATTNSDNEDDNKPNEEEEQQYATSPIGSSILKKNNGMDVKKRAREVEAAPVYLRRRIEEGQAMPRVEMRPAATTTTTTHPRGNRTTVLTGSVLEYVLVDMKDELFIELKKMMD